MKISPYKWLQGIFVNYWADSGYGGNNETVARVVMGLFLGWKIASLPIGSIATFPVVDSAYGILRFQNPVFLTALQVASLLTVIAFVYGYKFRLASFLLGTFSVWFGVHVIAFTISGKTQTFFLAGMFCYVFGALHSKNELNRILPSRYIPQFIQNDIERFNNREYDGKVTNPLAWILFLFSLLYFISGLQKISVGPFTWFSAENFHRIVNFSNNWFNFTPAIWEFLNNYPTLLFLMTLGAVAVEVGVFLMMFLDGLYDNGLTNAFFSLSVFSLIIFHIMTMVVMGPFFPGEILIACLFLNWERVLPVKLPENSEN